MSHEAVIRLLPDQIINKIAAGEVVDRPASVVKELMENALDAGATSIEVAVVDGGVKLLSVSDNGSGMDRDNALLAVERHATSKIRHVDDIERVATLGFRGEALAAMASVSRFQLTTRRASELTGTSVRINGGRMEEVQEAGCPPGTCIQVRQLFFNVPARRKFLKSMTTELNHIRQVFLLYAMGRPDVGLRLVVDEREIYRLDPDSQLEDRIRQLYGPELLRDLRTVDWTDGIYGIRGLISHPRLSRADKGEQYVYINGRPASAPVLGYAISEAYQAHLPRGRHPLLFLFVDLPPEDVDVNVHPTKREVRFRRSGQVRDAMIEALRRGLADEPAGSPSTEVDGTTAPPALPQSQPAIAVGEFLAVPDLPVLPAFQYPAKKDIPAHKGPVHAMTAVLTGQGERPVSGGASVPLDGAAAPWSAPWRWCRILGQIAGYFVVLESDEGMMLLDPQAAHERVIYERMLKQEAGRSVITQGLLVPETVTLPPVRAGLIRKHIGVLRELGLGVSEFGETTFIIDSLPALLGAVAAEELLADLAAELEVSGKTLRDVDALKAQLAQTSAQVAVRTTTQLSREELERLVSDLALTDLPYTSPRGRPTLIFTSVQELKKKFGRA